MLRDSAAIARAPKAAQDAGRLQHLINLIVVRIFVCMIESHFQCDPEKPLFVLLQFDATH